MLLLVYVAFFTVVWTTASVRAGPIVTTTLGRVEGITSRAHDGTPVDVFRGIPYALPPVGDLRWKAPSPAEPWNGVFDASQFGSACLQLDRNTLEIPSYGTYSEDCLTLNVYSPDVSTMAKTFPVMVWIHGGSFKTGTGSAAMYEAEELVRKDVIVVTCNYRLSALGFLATEDEASPGNYGLLDQVLVLTWVRDNIAAFNGDVSRVTIFGTSAGGVSVAMHMLSPLSDGLFHRAITQSGSSLASWSVEQAPLAVTLYVAELVNCPSANSSDLEAHRDMMDCLRQVNASELMMAQKYIENWSPTVDGKFLPNMPLDLLTSGQYAKDVQLIIGTTKDEGIAFVPTFAGVGILNLTYEILVEELIPVLLEAAIYSDPTGVLAESVLFEYTNWDDPRGKGHLNDISPNSNITNKEGEWNTIQSASEIIDDIMFKCPMQIEAALHESNGVTVYMFALEYVTDIYAGIPFVLHALETVYVFGRPFKNNTFCSDAEAAICPHPDDYVEANERDRNFSDWMMDLWTNFAQKGNPTPGILGYGGVKWPKYAETLLTSTSRAYLRLDELSTTAQHYAARSSEYWHSYLYKLQNITESLPDGPATATTQAPSTETTAETTIYVTIGPVEPSEDSLWPLIWTLVGVGGAFLILAILEGVALILMKAKSKSNSKSVKTGSIDASVYKNEVYHNEIYDM